MTQQTKMLREKNQRTNKAVPDDVENEAVEEAADGGQQTKWERLLMFIHLHLIKDAKHVW